MRIVTTITVALVLIGLTGLSVHTINALRAERLAAQQATRPIVSEIDFYFEGLEHKRYDTNGQVTHQLTARKVIHREKDNRFILERPVFTFFHLREKPWVVTAAQGVSNHGRDSVDLSQDVVVSRERGPYNSQVRIDTQRLNVHANQRTAQTDAAVSFLENTNLMQGVGANIDFKKGVIKLISQIKIWYKLNF